MLAEAPEPAPSPSPSPTAISPPPVGLRHELGHPRGYVREQAIRELARLGADARLALARLPLDRRKVMEPRW
jgi:hypothetical protein